MSENEEKILDELRRLDPSDSMVNAIAVIRRAIEEVEVSGGAGDAILDMIDVKDAETMEYYLRPLDDNSIYNRLIALNEGKGREERVDRYRRALDIRQARRWVLLADSQAVVGNNSKASRFYKRALFFGPTEDVIDEVISAAARSERRVEKARKEIERSLTRLRSDPGSRKFALESAKYLLDLDRPDEADAVIKGHIMGSEEDFDLLFMKGCILFSKGEHGEASAIFGKLTEMNPDSLNARRCLNWSVQMLEMSDPCVD